MCNWYSSDMGQGLIKAIAQFPFSKLWHVRELLYSNLMPVWSDSDKESIKLQGLPNARNSRYTNYYGQKFFSVVEIIDSAALPANV